MFLHIIYRLWNYLLQTMLVLLFFAVIITSAIFLFIQTEYAKNIVAEQIEVTFNNHFQGNITIGTLDGLLPFQVTITDLELSYDDGVSEETMLQIDAVTINPGLWDLLFNKVRLNNLVLENPSVYLKAFNDTEYLIEHAFRPLQESSGIGSSFFREDRHIEIFAPAFKISSGRIVADRLLNMPDIVKLPDGLSAYGIDLTMRLEITEDQKYLDINTFNIDIPELEASPISVSGQIFNDEDYLELNQVQLVTNESSIILNSLIEGINLSEPDLITQVEQAFYDVELRSSTIFTNEFADVLVGIPEMNTPINLSGKACGFADDIIFSDMQMNSGESRLLFSGQLEGLLGSGPLNYQAELEHLNFTDKELQAFSDTFLDFPFKDWQKVDFSGDVVGNADSTGINIDLDLPKGTMNLNAWIEIREPWTYSGSLIVDGIDVSEYPSLNLAQSSIHINMDFSGQGFDPKTAKVNMDIDLANSYYDHYAIPVLQANIRYQDNILQPEFTYKQGVTLINGSGSIDYSQKEPIYDFSGEASQYNMADFFNFDKAPITSLNFYYDFNARGEHIDSIYGRANLDISESRVNGNILQPHQLYVDLDHSENPERSLRFTSTFMDMFIGGDVRPIEIMNLGKHWSDYFKDRITEEFLMDSVKTRDPNPEIVDQSVDLDFNLELKDIELLKSYFPDMPVIASNAHVQFNINASSNTFLISGGWKDRQVRVNGYRFEDPDVMLTAHFRHGRKLRDFSSLDLESKISKVDIGEFSLNGLSTIISLRQDTIHASHEISDFGEDMMFATEMVGILDSLSITTFIEKMELGNPGYFWETSEAPPIITYDSNQKMTIDNAAFMNDEQKIDIRGVFSPLPEDSVTYSLENVDLNRISRLIDGRVNFQGTLDAEFFTKSLNLQPIFQGGIFVDRFAIDEREVGDIDLTSNFNSDKRRFDTRLAIQMDTTKYASYLAENDNIGQDIVLDGYFLTPNLENPQDTLYHFDADFNEIDLWVLPYIATGIFETVEGRGDGTGTLTGNWDDFDFNADLYAHDGYVKPVFFNTNYYITGPVELDRHKGVLLDTLTVRDQARGTGELYGWVEFNDFQAERPLDITLEMNSLTFLNNSYEPDAYFYGNLGGTGKVNVTGSNLSPYVRTTEPVRTTSSSRLSIPLLDETRVDAQGQSINFVKDFDSVDKSRADSQVTEIRRNLDRDFAEVFQLDLQFIASDNNIMQLVFDPVTGEIMNAEGSGRIRIVLEDEDLQMFGGFDITSGDYQFVGGDIFTRRFNLLEGGSLRWDGDPVNAGLDITAAYRSRPNINSLLTQTVEDQAQRVPVDLLLDITGSIENIENDFYFEFPNSVDATQNAAILALLNSEEQKLLQATSLLFTGGFIAIGSVGSGQTQAFSSNMQSRTAQVGLSHLLSNQINTLLNSNMGNLGLDINFNLSGFDQADLGIALRLFDDRLVIHREGQVAGEQADIGDVGAKYQISNALSVELFHRKDPIPIVGTRDHLESVNGVGLEAQMQFNTWQQFRQRIWGAITGIFGSKENEDEES
ncbi:MAG: hypothetical protein WEB89_11500 [Balneolales bacterium]